MGTETIFICDSCNDEVHLFILFSVKIPRGWVKVSNHNDYTFKIFCNKCADIKNIAN